jgi:D-alanyl-D-alanine-carboxypeptidase/D-alanyl-D-alanine-endopeptidase
MARATWLVALAVNVFGWLSADLALASEFTETGAAAAETQLREHFEGKPGGMVVGFIDSEGSKVVGVGTLDDGSGRPVDGDTVFFIGSVTKTFTALLLAEMASRGEVGLDDPVAEHLPATARVAFRSGKEITLRHLAMNTSGLPFNPNNMEGADDRTQYETWSVDDMYECVANIELLFDPGSDYQYSNLGMSLLGEALARAGHKSYEELVVERICRPLGMTSTWVRPTAELRGRLAMGRDERDASTGPWQLDALAPAGAIHSTANDLMKYVAAHAGITETELTPLMKSTHVLQYEDRRGSPGAPGLRFGRTAMPWMGGGDDPPGMELLGHAGGAGSYHAWVGFDVRQRRGVVALTTDNSLSIIAVGGTLLRRTPFTEERLHTPIANFVGIGAALELAAETGELRITKVLPETPAEDAGLAAGEIIATIDDVATLGKGLEECVKLLRGPEGTKVRLGVLVPATSEARTVELTRRKFRT